MVFFIFRTFACCATLPVPVFRRSQERQIRRKRNPPQKFMETNEEISHSPINTQSMLSLIFGILTILFFCMGLIPFPFTGFICFPLSFLFGILALILGMISLNQIRRWNETGSPMAWIGIIAGGFILSCVICMVIAIAALFIFAPNSIHLPPFIQNFNI